MIATGIVRRVDELGRVVIPREVRRALKIKDGDPVEIFRDSDGIVLKKYTPTDDKQEAIDTLQEWLKDSEQSSILSDIERVTFKMLLDKATTPKEEEED